MLLREPFKEPSSVTCLSPPSYERDKTIEETGEETESTATYFSFRTSVCQSQCLGRGPLELETR